MRWKKFSIPENIKRDSDSTENRGIFYIEPLENGYGVNIGNSLRRVLLSSIMGTAVTRVKIDGILTEFATITGVKEDVSQIILNLKKLRVKLGGDLEEATLKLVVKGPGVVTAEDIEVPSLVEIMNKDQYIAELSDGGTINMEILVNVGRGYVEDKQHDKTDVSTEWIWVDSLYSPVLSVNYIVEDVRVGNRTNLDALKLEIVTDGTISADDALTYAATVLINHYSLFDLKNIEIEEPEEVVIDDEAEKLNKLLDTSVSELELSVRSANCLKGAEIETIRELVIYNEAEILKLKNFGRKSLTEIGDILKSMGLYFGMDIGELEQE